MIEMPGDQTPVERATARNIRCPNCHKTYKIRIADEGKDLRFLNMVTWDCPRCGRHNVTPFLDDAER
jgi:hypothetical protein